MNPPPLSAALLNPSVSSMFMNLFASDNDGQRQMQQAATHVLHFLGADDSQVAEVLNVLSARDSDLREFCKLFCRAPGDPAHQPPVVVHSDSGAGECVFVLPPAHELMELQPVATSARAMTQAGLGAVAVNLLLAALKARSGRPNDQRFLLNEIALVFKRFPETKLSPGSAEAIKNFVRVTGDSRLFEEETIKVLSDALEKLDERGDTMRCAAYLSDIDQQIDELKGEKPTPELITHMLAVHDEAIQSAEFAIAASIEKKLDSILGDSPKDLRAAKDQCISHKKLVGLSQAAAQLGSQLPEVRFKNDGAMVIAEPDKPCDPHLLFDYLRKASKVPHHLHFGALSALIKHGIRQKPASGNSNPFTAEVVRELCMSYAATSGPHTTESVSAIADAWLSTLAAPSGGEGEESAKPPMPSAGEVAQLLALLKNLPPSAAEGLAKRIEKALTGAESDESVQYPGRSSMLSLRVHIAAATGKLDESFIGALLEDPAVRDLSSAAQADVLDAILKLKPEPLARLGKAFGEALSLWSEEKVTALGCAFNALSLVCQGAEFDEVIGALAQPHTATPDDKLAPVLGAAFLGAVLKRSLTDDQLRTLAMNLDGIAVRAPDELAYPGITEAFCELAKDAGGRAALAKLENALVPHVCEFGNVVTLPVEKRQSCYMVAAACRAALHPFDQRLPQRVYGGPPGFAAAPSVYFGLCMYSHDLRHGTVKGFDRDSEKYLIYAFQFSQRSSHPNHGEFYASALASIAKQHCNDPGDAGRNAAAYLDARPNGSPSHDPDKWFDHEFRRLVNKVTPLWSGGQLNRSYEVEKMSRDYIPTGPQGAMLKAGLNFQTLPQ